MVGIRSFPFWVSAYFQGRTVSFRECKGFRATPNINSNETRRNRQILQHGSHAASVSQRGEGANSSHGGDFWFPRFFFESQEGPKQIPSRKRNITYPTKGGGSFPRKIMKTQVGAGWDLGMPSMGFRDVGCFISDGKKDDLLVDG